MSLRYQLISKIEKMKMVNYLIQHSEKVTSDTCTNLVEHPYGGKGDLLPYQGESTYELLIQKKRLLEKQ